MNKDFENWDDLTKNPELLKHYELLRTLGVWEYHEYLKNRINSYNKLLDVSVEIFNKTSIEELLQFVVTHLLNKVIPSAISFVLFDEASEELGETFVFKNTQLVSTDMSFYNISAVRDFFLKYPNPIQFSLFEYQMKNKDISGQLEALSPDLIVPIIGIGGFHGIIVLSRKILGDDYTREELSYIARLMAFTSVSIQNNIHHRHAITDRKTKIYNHSFFQRRLDEEIARVHRHDTTLALVVLDVDHFKIFNDTHGHFAGDIALESLAKVLKSCVRKEDIPARFGGEEFVVLLVDCSQESAWKAAERIRQSIEEMDMEYKNNILKITVSIGVCFVNKYLKYTAQELIERADKALYKSKKNGRNRTTLYRPGLYFKAHRAKQ
ncbi:MAG: GGDEF domain-containing protein [Spirochaetales bacterium]|nr:GGDEF domain-containing protein [Spirochaetales bacterium]